MSAWQLQEAKARLSELIRKAATDGPQSITLRGEPAAVIVSSEEYERLKQPRESLVAFMRHSPLFGLEMNLEREQTLTRKVDLK